MTTYATFAPGKSKGRGSEIKLAPGETLGFRKGKGYYAKTSPYAEKPIARRNFDASIPGAVIPEKPTGGPGTRPRTPPVSPYAALPASQIDAQASALAQSGLTPQQDEIRRQQALAAQQAQADKAAITGFQTAAGDLMSKVGPQALDGFLRASREQGQLGQGLATGVRDDVAARVAADQAFAQSQGQSSGPGVDTAALHDTVYGLTGQIPGDTFAEQGAAMNQWGLAQAPIALNAGREELDARMAQARQTNDQYAQQLIQLAGQFPGLKAQALQQLNAYELEKANYREGLVNDAAKRANDKEQIAIQKRSLDLQAEAAGLTAANRAEEMKYRWASLQFQTAKARAAAQAAARKGKAIDTAASKLLGHIVYKDGTEDPSIKVKQETTGSSERDKAVANRTKTMSKARVTAFKYATELRGDPVAAPEGSKGAYVAAPGQKYNVRGGVFPPAYPGGPPTTNNPNRAARQGGAGSYADAQQKVWAMIDGDGIMARFGFSKEKVMAIVNDALARAGWKRK